MHWVNNSLSAMTQFRSLLFWYVTQLWLVTNTSICLDLILEDEIDSLYQNLKIYQFVQKLLQRADMHI